MLMQRLGRWTLRGEGVAILVGPNGSGKSQFLRQLALDTRGQRDVAVVCNTVHDRFSGVRGIHRLSVGRSGQSPKWIIKRAVAMTFEAPDSRYFQSGAILEYCGYNPRFGFRIELPQKGDAPPQASAHPIDPDLANALEYLGARRPETVWIDQRDRSIDGFRARDFVTVLKNEDWLRRNGFIKDITVHLDHRLHGVIDLSGASSGELSLISSLVFLISLPLKTPIILIDEPENSLHPTWQREYLDKILAAMTYRDASIVIATHAPLIVTGALVHHTDLLAVFQLQEGLPHQLALRDDGTGAESIEEILYRAFDVITPVSHFVSREMQDVVTRLQDGVISPGDAFAIVDEMDRSSFDERQHAFFGGVRQIIERFAAAPDQDVTEDD